MEEEEVKVVEVAEQEDVWNTLKQCVYETVRVKVWHMCVCVRKEHMNICVLNVCIRKEHVCI